MAQNKQFSWKGKSRGGSWGYLCFIFTINYLGIRAAYGLLAFVVPYFVLFAPKSNRAIWFYNRTILKNGVCRSFFQLFVHYYRFGQILIDKIAVKNGMADRYTFAFKQYDEFLEVLNSGSGVVMIGAHIGNWEIGTPFFNDYAPKINVVMYDAEYQKIKEVIGEDKDYKTILLDGDSIDTVFRIKSALDDHEYVCFQGDRYMNPKNTMIADFMGYPAKFPSGPFLVASRMKVPVVFYFAMREKGCRYRFHFVIAKQPVRRLYETMEEQLLKQYIAAMEPIVEAYPQQWFNFYKFWNE